MKTAKMIKYHDDPPCTARLDHDGYCPECHFTPDMQSTCIKLYCPLCEIPLVNLACPRCKQVFENPGSREAESVLCCEECETPLAEVIHIVPMPGGEMKEIGRSGSGQYCIKCKMYRIGSVYASFFNFCPDCHRKLEKKNETHSECPMCKQLFKTTD